jgi:predicted Zn-dependent peptidase
LKGNLMLSLESTSSRMTHLARQDIYFDHHSTLDETLAGIESVTVGDIQRVASDLFANGSLAATVLGAPGLPKMDSARLDLD